MARKTNTAAKDETDAIALLTTDHKTVRKLFKQFETLKEEGSGDQKEALVRQVCGELKVHTQVEEEIFYPAVRKAIEEEDLLDEAEVEHAGAKDLVAQLEGMSADDDLFDAKVTVLGEQVEHHVKEEEQEMFPKVRKAKVDTAALGEAMFRRKQELMDEAGLVSNRLPSRSGMGRRKGNGASTEARR